MWVMLMNALSLSLSADRNQDYSSPVTQALEFPACTRSRQCADPITIINDRRVENVENFQLFLRSNNEDLVRPEPNLAIVTVFDDGERKC